MPNNAPNHIAACIAAFLFVATPLSTATATEGAAFAEQSLLAQRAQITHHRLTGQASFIGTEAGKAIALPGTGTQQSASAAAMDALNAYGSIFGLRNPAGELSQKSLKTTGDGHSVLRYQQSYNGIPVIGGEMIVNLSSNNALLSINGETAPRLAIPTTATVTIQQATATALAAVAKWYETTTLALSASTPVLSVYEPKLIGPGTFPASLVWRIEVSSTDQKPIRELVLIDAQRGHISLHFNQIDTALSRSTHDAGDTATLPGTLVCDETDPTCSTGTGDAVDAHQFARDTYDFYNTKHGRDSIDDAGMTIISSVNWNDGMNCPNAFWDGSQMVYCAGVMADDVVAHELTHGVTENESNLFYYYQSGAINESLSDVWGEFVDQSNSSGLDGASYNWQIGEDLNVSGLVGPIRHMNDPTLDGDPDRITSANYQIDSSDNGGVHVNSGINNKAAYLMAAGDTFNGKTVTGIGNNKVARIYYEVQTKLLTSGADYLDLYNALYQGCQNLIGTAGITSGNCDQVRKATDAVEMNKEPTKNFNPDTTSCSGGKTPKATAFYDNFENGLGNWTLTNSGGTNWVAWNATWGGTYGPYATSGLESLYGENLGSSSDLRATITVTVPNKNPFLYFRHAYDLETGFDGAVLEYSTDGGSTWNDTDSMIVAGKEYDDTIASNYGSPLGGKSAFTGTSHGYVSTRVKLNSLRGKTIQLRWRVVSDSSYAYLGWIVDDVGVYQCPSSGGGGGTMGWPFLLLGLLPLLALRRRNA